MWAACLRSIKETLFPCFCVSCQAEGSWWCGSCRAAFPQARSQYCPVCHAPTAEGESCAGCTSSALHRLTSLYTYDEKSSIGVLIKLFKYHGAHDIQQLLVSLLSAKLCAPGSVIIPVPLYHRRLRERGYNQAERIAQALSDHKSYSVDTTHLVRTRYTEQQAKLDRAGRFRNMSGAFEWRGGVAPARCVLVDDVYTTGATMQECARVLRRHGARYVEGFVLARD